MFKGKAIYNPSGKAGEYSYWACNFYIGCSNGCRYCYLKKGIGKAVLGGDTPVLKKCFRDEAEALEIFEKELKQNLPELQEHGLFFSFTTDPMLPETMDLTIQACNVCVSNKVPVKILTKIDFIQEYRKVGYNQFAFPFLIKPEFRYLIAFGFTLTGCDEMEPGASPNEDRIEAMKKLHEAGFRTFASIEPVIDLDDSFKMICRSMEFCDLFKIGLESGKAYPRRELIEFIEAVYSLNHTYPYPDGIHLKVYFKDGLLKQAGVSRENFPVNCVGRDYNIFQRENV